MHYHLVLTDECNLSCRYCRGRAFDDPELPEEDDIDMSMPSEFLPEPEEVHAFLAADPKPVLIFYGGEPLMRLDRIREIMNGPENVRYFLYTNGILLDRLDADLAGRLDVIHVSVDGPEALTDYYRGKGTYRTVMENIRMLCDNGFEGEIIARMTVGEMTDIREAVLHLSKNSEFPFKSIHWQLDANFSGDFYTRGFRSWVEDRYNPGITALVSEWLRSMGEGSVPRWYPFIETVSDLLNNRATRMRCGAGYANYAIMPDGSIGPCPVMTGMKKHVYGHIRGTNPLELHQVEPDAECSTCDIAGFCGGRCLYSQITRPWPPEGRRLVCDSVHHLCRCLSDSLPEIRRHIEEGTVSEMDFQTERFNGCEIIP